MSGTLPARYAALAQRALNKVSDAPWGRVVWRVWGAGQPIVLLNGGTGSWLHWVRTIPAFEPGYQVLVPDLPGMGDSDAPRGIEPVEALVESMGDAIFEGLEQLLPRATPHVLGFSFGAMVGAFVGARYGPRLASYSMIGGSGLGLTFPGPRGVKKFGAGASNDALREVHRANMGAIMFGDAAYEDAEALEMQLINASKVRVRSHTAAVTTVMQRPIAAMSSPKLGLWGDRDPFFPTDERALAEQMTRWSMAWRRIPNAGHWAQYQNAPAVNAIVSEFIGDGAMARAGRT